MVPLELKIKVDVSVKEERRVAAASWCVEWMWLKQGQEYTAEKGAWF
jgi:hypothetical protein